MQAVGNSTVIALAVGATVLVTAYMATKSEVVIQYLYLTKLMSTATIAHIYRKTLRPIKSLANPHHEPYAGAKSISAVWLTKIFRRSGVINECTYVKSVTPRDILSGGLVGFIQRFNVVYEGERGDAPESIVMKATESGLSNHIASLIYDAPREAGFFQEFSEYAGFDKRKSGKPRLFSATKNGLLDTIAPICYYSNGSNFSGKYLMLFEDVSPSALTTFYFGNQFRPSPPRESVICRHLFDQQEYVLRCVFRRLADMHGSFWCDKSLLQYNFLRASDWRRGKGRKKWQAFFNGSYGAWRKFKATYCKDEASMQAGESELKFSTNLMRIMDRSFEISTWDNVQSQFQDPNIPFTLTHGDFHAQNVLWKESEKKPSNNSSHLQEKAKVEIDSVHSLRFVDWPVVGISAPMADVAQFMMSDVRSETRRKYENLVVYEYWKRLVDVAEIDESQFSFEDCWNSYKDSVGRWIWMLGILCSFPLPAKAMQYFHDQVYDFVADHHALPDEDKVGNDMPVPMFLVDCC